MSYLCTVDQFSIPHLRTIDRFVAACCASPDIPVTCSSPWARFNPMILCHDGFPAHPSPALTSVMKQMAKQAHDVRFDLTTASSLTPAPKQSAIDLAGQLSFDNAKRVTFNSTHVDPNSPVRRPSFIEHMQPLPKADWLCLSGRLNEEASRSLASKMPQQLDRLEITRMPVGDAVGAIRALGKEREVGWVDLSQVVMDRERYGRADGIAQLVGAAADLPVIKSLELHLTVREDLAGKAEAEYVRGILSSLLQQLRGLRRLEMYLPDISCPQAVTDGTTVHGFHI
mmetsp:Transcript_23883/g.68699  ORF Transcript_23883/g.68699 Transcript_23883/m.68699 type:complete len:284 (-) Transcript_23883:312-1163(-)